MGQRHQVFLIARIIPHGETHAKYRCVAAMHHQWCFGTLPLRATRRLLTLLKKPEHAKIVAEEIRALDGEYGRWRVAPEMPKVPCVFSSFLMYSAFNYDLQDDPQDLYVNGSTFGFNNLSPNMGSFEGDNNDGITVIDITDPKNPAYCFVFLPYQQATKTGIPLTATDYIRKYYLVPKSGEQNDDKLSESDDDGLSESDDDRFPEPTVLNVIAALEGERLVTPQMLVEAWPLEYKQPFKKQDQVFETGSGFVPTVPQIPFLSDLTLKPAVVHALENGDTKDIEQLLWLPGKVQTIFGILKCYKPFPDSGIPLLAQALNHFNPESIDISNFSLSATQIVTLLANFSHVQILDLSHNPLVTAGTVRTVLESIPTLKHLVLLDTSVTNEALSSLLQDHQQLFLNIEALIHPFLLEDSEFPNAFAIIHADRGSLTGASIPYFTPSFIVQALTDFLRAYLHEPYYRMECDLPRVVLSSTIRKATESWGDRTVPMIASPAVGRALSGEGWIFGVKGLRGNASYGFIEAKPDNYQTSKSVSASDGDDELDCVARVLSLEDFLTEMKSQGRPPAPASAVDALCAILDQLKAFGRNSQHRCSFGLMTISEANAFIAQNGLSSRW